MREVWTILEDDTFILLLDDRRLKGSNNCLQVRVVSESKTCVSKIEGMASKACSAIVLTSSNTFFKPFWVNAEHSTYFTAPSSLASLSPISDATGRCFCLCSFSITCGSSLKSIWVPTIRHGTPGQW